jgi:hypothetical protein
MFAQGGARLSYVVVKLEGTVKRSVTRWDKKKREIVKEFIDQPAGYMVYFPMGHCLRMRDKAQLKQYNLHRKPRIINLEGLHDPNSPIGKMMMADDDEIRRGAYADLEKLVIRMATAKTGSVLMPEQVEGGLSLEVDDDIDADEAA